MTIVRASWTALATSPGTTPILPDGCRDLICLERKGMRPFWFISPLQSTPSPSGMRVGDRLSGFRLAPGAQIETAALLPAVQGRPPDPQRTRQHLMEFTGLKTSLGEALTCLGETSTISQTAAELGVSLRSLQRLVQRETGKSPGFWHGLARVRLAARLITTQTPLAEAAYLAGFADQAHMTRAFRRWFAVTPRGFLADPQLRAQASSLAYG